MINERGEFIRETDAPEKKPETPDEQIAELKRAKDEKHKKYMQFLFDGAEKDKEAIKANPIFQEYLDALQTYSEALENIIEKKSNG